MCTTMPCVTTTEPNVPVTDWKQVWVFSNHHFIPPWIRVHFWHFVLFWWKCETNAHSTIVIMTIKYYYSSDSSSFGVSRKLKYCIIRPNLTEYSDPLLLCSESICAESSVPLTHFVTNPFPPICFSATSFLCDDNTSLWIPILLCSNVLSCPVRSYPFCVPLSLHIHPTS